MLGISQLKNMLIFPGSWMKSTMDTLEHVYPGSSIIPCVTHSGHQIGLLFGSATGHPPSNGPFYLLYFYGNGTRLHTCSHEFAYFRQLGLHVIIPEYPGYGISSGRASEDACYEAADAAYHYLTAKQQIPSSQIILGGMSLGAAVAIDLASRKHVAGLMAFAAFTNIPEQARAMMPYVPKAIVRLCVTERFDNLGKIASVACPIFLGHGTHDELVPFTMAEQLVQAAPHDGSVTFFPIQRGGHNDLLEVGSHRLRTGIVNFTMTLRHKETRTADKRNE
jgi:pimeloyl-ACP methyl ester carboxylesterase